MMEDSKKLDDWLAAARADLSERTPDLLAEQRLLSRVREIRALQSVAATRVNPAVRQTRRPRFWRSRAKWVWFPALAAAIALVGIGIVMFAPGAPDRDIAARTPFLALVASDAIAAERSALVVSSQVSGAALADYGLPVDPARVDQPINAEFLLSPAGVILAVRFTE